MVDVVFTLVVVVNMQLEVCGELCGVSMPIRPVAHLFVRHVGTVIAADHNLNRPCHKPSSTVGR